MPCLSDRIENNKPLCHVRVFAGSETALLRDVLNSRNHQQIENLVNDTNRQCTALLDTGASFSSISRDLSEAFDMDTLDFMGMRRVGTAGGNIRANCYNVTFLIPILNDVRRPINVGTEQVYEDGIIHAVIIRGINVAALPINARFGFNIILGMDVINHGSLTVGGGMFRFCM